MHRKKTSQGRESMYYAPSDINKFNTVKYFCTYIAVSIQKTLK